MMCAVTVRQIKPDSYDEFRKAWEHADMKLTIDEL